MKSLLFSIIILGELLFNQLTGVDLFVKETLAQDAIKIQKRLDQFYSNKKLGSFVENGNTFFRLFAPSAERVELVTFKTPDSKSPNIYSMTKDTDGVWEAEIKGENYGLFYGFKVFSAKDISLGRDVPIAVDPYAKAVATYTTYENPRLAIVYKDVYDWHGDSWIRRDWSDLVIYEMHVRDMTMDPTSRSSKPGSYEGLIESGIKGGLEYIKKLGVNTVELLPTMEYGYLELPYKDSLDSKYNDWNPYERNHWGYMTSNFFAPASYYSTSWKKLKRNVWMGTDARQVNEFKDMVKAFHRNGIGVIMDVVYNHLSEYEVGNLKQIDKYYYFRLNNKGEFISKSFCGNDLRTEAPMLRRLIIESVLYWMKEFHVDGFRFDLGKLIDWETLEEIIREARKINPDVVFVCEPWGGGYDPTGFSLRGWGAWNDRFRNGVKGENPFNHLGWIFNKWYDDNNIKSIENYVNGTLLNYKSGLFVKYWHSVNYLESHDDYTLGDFIRLAVGRARANEVIRNVDSLVKLTPRELKLHKLAALFLFTSRGITMISEGQEFARSKVIPWNETVPDKFKGTIDHNSYNKDNETNYINYSHAEINKELVDYYKGLILLRKTYPAFRRANKDSVKFVEHKQEKKAFGYLLHFGEDVFFVAFNPNPRKTIEFNLPSGEWQVLVDEQKAGVVPLKTAEKIVSLKPTSGIVCKLK